MGLYSNSGLLAKVTTNVGKLTYEITDLVQDAQLDLSIQQTSQFTLSVLDPDMLLLQGSFLKLNSPIWIGTQQFIVRVRAMQMIGSQLGLQITARSAGVVLLEGLTGTLLRRNLSPTQWLKMDCDSVGLKLVAQPSPVRSSIARTNDPAGTNESSWDVFQRLAQELGYWCFEAGGTVYFGQPTWLVAHLPMWDVRWRQEETTDPLIDVPLMTASADDTTQGITGTLTITPDASDVFVPGYGAQLSGISSDFDGGYLITGLTLDMNGKSPGQVTLSQPINPVPGAGTVKSASNPNSGNYQSKYPLVYPGPVNATTGWTWPAEGAIKGSTSTGISIYAPAGTNVTAPGGGRVVKVSATSGPAVRIDCGNGLFVEVTHLGSVNVAVGQVVARGQKVGTVGSATDPYVHIQVFQGTAQVAPTPFLPTIPS